MHYPKSCSLVSAKAKEYREIVATMLFSSIERLGDLSNLWIYFRFKKNEISINRNSILIKNKYKIFENIDFWPNLTTCPPNPLPINRGFLKNFQNFGKNVFFPTLTICLSPLNDQKMLKYLFPERTQLTLQNKPTFSPTR